MGADGAEQKAARAAHEAEGDDVDEAMEGDENISLQRAERGSGSIGGIKKAKRRRAKVNDSGWLAARVAVLRPAEDEASAS